MRPPPRLPRTASLLVLISLLTTLASAAARLTFTLPAAPHLPQYNPATLPASTRATLFRHNHTLAAPLTRRSTFEFAAVSRGSWLFTVQCRDYTFGPLRVDVLPAAGADDAADKVEAFQTFWGNEWGNKGAWRGGGVVDGEATLIEARPDRLKEYYVERSGFSPLGFLKSPMILMALFSLVLIVGIPYLTENMDEETKKEFEELQQKSPVAQAAGSASGMQNFDLAGWMAGKTAAATAGSSSSGGGGGG